MGRKSRKVLDSAEADDVRRELRDAYQEVKREFREAFHEIKREFGGRDRTGEPTGNHREDGAASDPYAYRNQAARRSGRHGNRGTDTGRLDDDSPARLGIPALVFGLGLFTALLFGVAAFAAPILGVVVFFVFLAMLLYLFLAGFRRGIGRIVGCTVGSVMWLVYLLREGLASLYLHRDSPAMLRLRGRRRAFGRDLAGDWRALGRLFIPKDLEHRAERARHDWRRYVATQSFDPGEAPSDFPEQYVVVDELPRGGSGAKLYVVRKAEDDKHGPLYVLKYFNLKAGGRLESVMRESQAVPLAKRMGLILESDVSEHAFWYLMPYYSGETLTAGVVRNIRQAREGGPRALAHHQKLTLGYVHQLLQIIGQYHEAGVFHKDIKPDNLIINGKKIYLVDIGLMTPLSSMAQLTTHGTEYFRDPEMVRLALEGREVREVDAAKFDVYSIGAVLFFAICGDFPTAGALSRLPSEVPMAVQWVINRAMTSMNQRYANARAMLTDIDYLCYAASRGELEFVKPADLPSFRGMPMPAHLAPSAAQAQPADAPLASGPATDRLAAAPGGYGAWYAAPRYGHSSSSDWRVFWIIMALGGIAVMMVFFLVAGSFAAMEQPSPAPPTMPVVREAPPEHLPDEAVELAPIFHEINSSLRSGVSLTERKHDEAMPHDELAPRALADIRAVIERHEREILARLRQQGLSKPGALFERPRVAFLAIGGSAAAARLADELAASDLSGPNWDEDLHTRVAALCATMRDRVALHRELAVAFAEAGRIPPFLVLVNVAEGEDAHTATLRVIYPGREDVLGYILEP